MKKLSLFFSFLLSICFSSIDAQVCPSFKVTDNLGNDDITIDCNYPLIDNQCIRLVTTASTTRETSTYEMEAVAFTPYIAFNAGTPLNANYDDLFAHVIDIPFAFCFFGNNYNKLVIGSNGLVTFDLSQAGKISYPNIEHSNPDPRLPKNSIFGVYQDLVFSNSDPSEIYYSIIETPECRKLVINYYEGRIAGCNERSSTQIVLSEFTNEIEIFVDRKAAPCETARFSHALLGIMNADGSVGYSPDNRNTGIWEANQEAWKFSPSGNVIAPLIEWFDLNNTRIGAGNTIQVCPEQNTKYTAKATYNICGVPFVLTDSIDVNFSPDFPLARDYTKVFCTAAGASELVELDDYRQFLTPQNPGNLLFSYHNSPSDAQSGINSVASSVDLTSGRIFYVRIQNPTDSNCFRVAELRFQFSSTVILTDSVTICDTNNDGIENNFQLSLLTSQLFASNISGTVTYYLSQTDAQSGTNAVTTANIVAGTQLWLRFTTAGCSQMIGPVTVNFTPGPAVNSPIDFNINICDINDDNKEPFDFPLNISALISTDPDVSFFYYSTFAQAYSGGGTQVTTVREGMYSVFVRVEEPGGCFSVAEVRLNVTFSEVEANRKITYLCFDGTEDVEVDLLALSQSMLLTIDGSINITFHSTAAHADAGTSPISSPQIITENGNSITKIYYVRFERAPDCYTVRTLTVILTHPIVAQNSFDICDIENDGTETVSVNQFTGRIAGAQSATATYFLNAADATGNTNPISTVTIAGTIQLHVRIVVNSCVKVYPINLKLTATPVVTTQLTLAPRSICDNNNDLGEAYNLTQHQAEIYSGAQPVTYTYFNNYNATTNTFSGQISNPGAYVATGDNTVFVRVQFSGGVCFSVSSLRLQLNFLPAPVIGEATIRKCDEQFNFGETFNLNSAIAEMFDQTQNSIQLSNIEVSYYNTAAEAHAGLPATRISSNKVTLVEIITVYARFESKTNGCFSVKPIHLRTYFPPKAIGSIITGICDTNLDGTYDVDLTQYTRNMVDIPNPEHNFEFYLTSDDAQNDRNKISNPEKFEIASLPARIFVKIHNLPGCDDIAYIDLRAGEKITLVNSGPFSYEICDEGNDGTEVLNLKRYETSIFPGATFEYFPTLNDLIKTTNKITNPENFTFNKNINATSFYVKISTPGLCATYVQINVNLKRTPMFTLPDYYFCPYGGDSVDIQPDFTGLNIVSYEWRNPSGTVVSTENQLRDANVAGTYTISVVASNDCTFTTTFEVKNYEVPIITQLTANGNSYTVTATGSKSILYSIDGVTWQTSNVFLNLPVGQTTFYVKFSGEECIGLPKKGVILNIPNAFTPNDDGINDVWEIKDLNVFDGANSTVQIFDRQQVLVHQEEAPDRLMWNGRWQGRAVPTDTYWYVLKLPDGRQFFGWIFLRNRD